MASEAQEEIARVRALRAVAVAAAGFNSPPESILWDAPDEGFGYKLSKIQQLVIDDIKAYRLLGLIRRAKELLPNDQRRMAFLTSHECKFSNCICSGTPLCPRIFHYDLWATAVQSKLGAKLTWLAPIINRNLTSNMPSVDDNYVELYGSDIKN